MTAPHVDVARPRQVWTWAAAAAIALPAVMVLLFVRAEAVNVPYWDEWESVTDILAAIQRRLTIGDLWRQHNEHRIFFPRVVMLGLYAVSRMDSRVLMYANVVLLWVTVGLILADHLRSLGNNAMASVSFVPAAWILFSLRQWENLLWGWQIQIFMCTALLVLALHSLSRADRPVWLVIAITAGVACCYSFSAGMLVWPAGLFHLFVSDRQSLRRRAAILWCAAGTAALVVYFIGYRRPEYHPSTLSFLRQPFDALGYFLASVGGSLAIDLGGAITAGVLLSAGVVTTAVWVRRRGLLPRASMAMSLIVFSALASALLMIGRAGFGPAQALDSKYTTLTSLGVVGFYLMLAQNLDLHPRARWILAAFLGMAALGESTVTINSIDGGRAASQHRRQLALVLKRYQQESDAMLAGVYPVPSAVRERAAVLEQHRLSVFAHRSPSLVQLPGAPPFSVDLVNSAPSGSIPTILAGTPLRVSGWAVDDQARAAAEGVIIFVDDGPGTTARYGLDRPDVAKALGNDAYRYSGFAAEASTSSLRAGRHSLGLRIFNAEGTGVYEPPTRFFFEVR
jgi:hypothetical protein